VEHPNCWEFLKCGREPGGPHAHEVGVCPAAVEGKLDGIHAGKNGGRACWLVSGTIRNGVVQGTFGKKYKVCQDCSFFNLVKLDEGGGFMGDVARLVEYF
jgi:hypothetical protein